MYESYHQEVIVFKFYARFHELIHSFGIPGKFTLLVRADTYLRDIAKKLIISVFYGLSHELLSTFLGFQGDLHQPKTRYMFYSITKNPSFSRVMAVFMIYCP